MRLYHGSNTIVKQIDLRKSHPNKDFGKAFYLSAELEQAQDMADFKAVTLGGSAVVNVFEIDDDVFHGSDLRVLTFKGYTEEWARFVLRNRDLLNGEEQHDFDIVYGPIADDRVGRQIIRFKDGDIDFATFLEKLKFMKGITFQYVFCSEKAISKLKPL